MQFSDLKTLKQFFPNSGYAIRVLIVVKDRIRNRNPPLGLAALVCALCDGSVAVPARAASAQ